jgi:hypothetical protein
MLVVSLRRFPIAVRLLPLRFCFVLLLAISALSSSIEADEEEETEESSKIGRLSSSLLIQLRPSRPSALILTSN